MCGITICRIQKSFTIFSRISSQEWGNRKVVTVFLVTNQSAAYTFGLVDQAPIKNLGQRLIQWFAKLHLTLLNSHSAEQNMLTESG